MGVPAMGILQSMRSRGKNVLFTIYVVLMLYCHVSGDNASRAISTLRALKIAVRYTVGSHSAGGVQYVPIFIIYWRDFGQFRNRWIEAAAIDGAGKCISFLWRGLGLERAESSRRWCSDFWNTGI